MEIRMALLKIRVNKNNNKIKKILISRAKNNKRTRLNECLLNQ